MKLKISSHGSETIIRDESVSGMFDPEVQKTLMNLGKGFIAQLKARSGRTYTVKVLDK